MIEVYKYSISKHQLEVMPVEDRDLFLLAGHALNATNAWTKILRFSSNNESDGSLMSVGTTYQSHLITRSLYGHIVEAAQWLDRGATKTLIETYLPSLDPESLDAYNEIRKRLDEPAESGGKGSISPILSRLRNQFAFHFPKPNALQVAFEYTKVEEDWSLYISEEHSNSCYWASELVVGFGSLALTGVASSEEAFSLVLQETLKAANALNQFLVGLMPAIMRRYLPRPQAEVMFVPGAPDGTEFKLPFYCERL
jgi:hypothetical protein